MINFCKIESPIGDIYIFEENNKLVQISSSYTPSPGYKNEMSDFLFMVSSQLTEYFEGKRKEFDIPVELRGTEFQLRVWRALGEIPYGETRTYKQIAEKIGNIKAVRAVGGANNKNPLMIIIPCHRVVGSDNSLVGYASGVDKKEYLLNLENRYK